MKHLILIFIICISGCSQSWPEKDKQLFIDDCLEAYGTHKTCYCILNCLESEYDNYKHVLQKIPASKIKKELNECLIDC